MNNITNKTTKSLPGLPLPNVYYIYCTESYRTIYSATDKISMHSIKSIKIYSK